MFSVRKRHKKDELKVISETKNVGAFFLNFLDIKNSYRQIVAEPYNKKHKFTLM